MEKISSIVRGNARVSSADAKGSTAVRPGAPSFGRPMGESSGGPAPTETTAARAVAIHNEMNEAKKLRTQDNTVVALADQFFMSRIRRPDDEVSVVVPSAPQKAIAKPLPVEQLPESDVDAPEMEAGEIAQPAGFVPRGSYVNVHA